MNFEFSSDQATLLDAVNRVVTNHGSEPLTPRRYQYSPELARDLADAGFYDCWHIEELGAVAATAMVIALAASPLCTEAAASAIVAPMLDLNLPGPHAVLLEGSEQAPVRFLPVANTLIRIGSGAVEVASMASAEHQVEACEGLFAYPMGMLRDAQSLTWTAVPSVNADAVRNGWRVAIAAEIVGCLDAGLKAVLEHVRNRRQFGRPLGSFQAIQHRLAECTTLIEGARWLVLKAADSQTPLDALIASAQAQRITTRVCYDLHQFMGAMGLTLEHPLHRWTYRAKYLRSDLGGADRQFIAAADSAWGPNGAVAQQAEMEVAS